jgi:hypothetical protein
MPNIIYLVHPRGRSCFVTLNLIPSSTSYSSCIQQMVTTRKPDKAISYRDRFVQLDPLDVDSLTRAQTAQGVKGVIRASMLICGPQAMEIKRKAAFDAYLKDTRLHPVLALELKSSLRRR